MSPDLLRCALQELLVLLAQAIDCEKCPSSAGTRHVLMVDVVLCELSKILAASSTECGQ